MGKKNSKKSKISDSNQKFAAVHTLHPTELGEQKLAEIRKKYTARLFTTARSNIKAEEDVGMLDKIEQFNDSVDTIVDRVKHGEYDNRDKLAGCTVDEFIDWYQSHDNTTVGDHIAEKLIRIAKSYWEYDPEQHEFMSNQLYDTLLSVYLHYDNIEPFGGYLPRLQGATKVDIRYPTLHNNIDKAYIINASDPIPDGVKETDSVEKFLQRVYKSIGIPNSTVIQLELSPKIDGVSVNGTIVDDVLSMAQSRGDTQSLLIKGLEGIAVTVNPTDKKFGIQYELFVTEEDRVKLSEDLGLKRPYISCRHAASGVMSRLTVSEEDGLLERICLYPIEAEGLDMSYQERMEYLQNFAIVPSDMPARKLIEGDFDKLLRKIKRYFTELQELRNSLSFAIDGMVITVVDSDYQDTIGREGRTNRYQIALKFDPSTAEAKVKGVWLDTGTKGYRTIQVELDHPVFLDGVRYDHVPVLSYNLFKELGLRYGSVVSIHRVGDVIPAIKVVSHGTGELIPSILKCPSCEVRMVTRNGKLYCNNPYCKDNISGRIIGFFDAIGLDDYGEGFVGELIQKLNVTSIGDMIHSCYPDMLEKHGITGVKAARFRDRLHAAIQSTIDYKLVGGLGIPAVGPAKAKTILQEFTVDELLKFREKADKLEKLESFDRYVEKLVGPQSKEFTKTYLLSQIFHDDLEGIKPLIKKVYSAADKSNLIFVGHSGIDGDNRVKTRIDEMPDRFEYVDNQAFDVLVVKSHDYTSKKVERAKKKGLPIYTIEEFLEQFKP